MNAKTRAAGWFIIALFLVEVLAAFGAAAADQPVSAALGTVGATFIGYILILVRRYDTE